MCDLSSADEDVRAACLAALEIRKASSDKAALSNAIYSEVYARGWRVNGARPLVNVQQNAAFNASFLRQIQSSVNATERSVGWKISSENFDTVTLTRGGIVAVAPKDKVFKCDETSSVEVSVLRLDAPGFIYRRRNREYNNLNCRVYLAITPEQASWFLGDVADMLEDDGIPFEMKVLSNPLAYWRQDAAVLYVPISRKNFVLHKIDQAQSLLKRPLRRNELLLTLHHATGVRLAEQPLDGRSHGQWVTDMLVDATGTSNSLDEVVSIFWELVSQDGRSRSCPAFYSHHC